MCTYRSPDIYHRMAVRAPGGAGGVRWWLLPPIQRHTAPCAVCIAEVDHRMTIGTKVGNWRAAVPALPLSSAISLPAPVTEDLLLHTHIAIVSCSNTKNKKPTFFGSVLLFALHQPSDRITAGASSRPDVDRSNHRLASTFPYSSCLPPSSPTHYM